MSPIKMNTNIAGLGNTAGISKQSKPAATGQSFESHLQAQIDNRKEMKLSAHAEKRLAERNVHLGDSERARLGAAMDRVAEKGADKSLVLMDNLALLVSARNRVVITAMDSKSAREGVFTNIDSAVIA